MMRKSQSILLHGLKWACLSLALALLGYLEPLPVWSQTLPDFRLDFIEPRENGWMKIHGGQPYPWLPVVSLQASTNLATWEEVARLHGMPFQYEDRGTRGKARQFYRFQVTPLEQEDDWKNQIGFNMELFSRSSSQFSYVKFVIRADDLTRVYYADSGRYLFHHDFVSARIEPYSGIGLGEFERLTRFNEGRKLFLGAVLMGMSPFEYGIQFDAGDPLPPETVRELFGLVASTVVDRRSSNSAPVRAFYIPSFDQAPAAQADAAYFASHDIPVAGIENWLPGDVCYSSGWHFGRLQFVTATNIASAYASGLLLPADILLTDGVPSEIPYVAGIITLQPATPNSHVVLLAQSFAVPFVYLHDPAEQQRVRALSGTEVALRARAASYRFGHDIRVFALPADLPANLKAELLALKSNAPVRIATKTRYGNYFASTDLLWPSNICHFGGKAANYGLLRRTIPTNAPVAMALSMDLWDDFMSQTLPDGAPLRAEISNQLAGFTTLTNIAALTNTLAGIRELIRRTASFSPAQRQAITNALVAFGFEPARKIRFRSSTNVEDSEAFSGAGLYDSYSGCLAYDLAAGASGSSERGVFQAIQRVYASFYNDNAYLARRLHAIDENIAGMGVLVHYSTPDDTELANGVATLTAHWSLVDRETFNCTMVTQKGAVPVANPEGNVQAEVQQGSYWKYSDGSSAHDMNPSAYSSLVPLGACVMDYPDNYETFFLMFIQVARVYHDVFPEKLQYTLDFEYKKVTPDWLEVKQVREVPRHDLTNQVKAYLLDHPLVIRSDQGVELDTLTAHRLKSRWTFRARNMQLTPANLAQGIFSEVTWERAHNGRVETYRGSLADFPEYSQTPTESMSGVCTRWAADTPDGRARLRLTTYLSTEPDFLVPASEPWIAFSDAGGMELLVDYEQPVWWYSYSSGETNDLLTESIYLSAATVREDSDSRLDYEFVITNGTQTVVIKTGFWATNPDIYTDYPRLKGEMETRIDGLTAAPIELRGFFSQTWSSVHFRYADRFVFEPRLEEGLAPAIVDALNAANIRFLLVTHLDNIPRLQIMGLDGLVRDWGQPAATLPTVHR